MILFLYDTTHQFVVRQRDMGEMTPDEIAVAKEILRSINDWHLTVGHRELVLASGCQRVEKAGGPALEFN